VASLHNYKLEVEKLMNKKLVIYFSWIKFELVPAESKNILD